MSEQKINKERIRTDLVQHLDRRVQADGAEISIRREDAEPVRDDEHRSDDVSHQDEAGDLHALFEEVDDTQVELVAAAKALDVSPKTSIEPGAVIEMDGEWFVVGVASDEFTSGGTSYSGLSSDAPIYAAIVGKQAGERATFGGREVTITTVA